MSFIDDVGYLVIDNEKTFKAKHNGYCSKCHHTFWSGEIVEKSEIKSKAKSPGFNHLDCLRALADETPRKLNPKFEFMFAGLDKAKLKKKAKKRIYQDGTV